MLHKLYNALLILISPLIMGVMLVLFTGDNKPAGFLVVFIVIFLLALRGLFCLIFPPKVH